MSRILLTKLRDTMPVRPLRISEAFRLAELQATKLLKASGVTDGPVPETVITDLARVRVLRVRGIPPSGATGWSGNTWTIIIKGNEPEFRQRFSMAHELKHAIDADLAGLLYPAIWNMSSYDYAEKVCDHFAACLLMPASWVERVYCREGVHNIVELTRRFNVSPDAMERRLTDLRLLDRAPRCLVGWERPTRARSTPTVRHATG